MVADSTRRALSDRPRGCLATRSILHVNQVKCFIFLFEISHKLFIFNMMLPTVDTFFDSVLIKKLFEDGYWGSG